MAINKNSIIFLTELSSVYYIFKTNTTSFEQK